LRNSNRAILVSGLPLDITEANLSVQFETKRDEIFLISLETDDEGHPNG